METGLRETISRIAAELAREHRVERSDLEQEMMLWVLQFDAKHSLKVDERPDWWVRKCLWRVGRNWVLREKAARSGGLPTDQYFYSRGEIADIIPYAVGLASVEDLLLAERDETTPAVGVDELAVRIADVKRAIRRLTADDKTFIFDRHDLGDWDKLAEKYGIATQSARNRYNRILRRMQKTLGGPNPRRVWE